MENFIIGMLITYFTGRFAGIDIKPLRIVLSGVISGIYSFSFFFPAYGLTSMPGKLIMSVVISWIAMGGKTARRIALNSLIFLCTTFFFGGITIAILNFTGWKGVSDPGGIYISLKAYIIVTLAGCAAAFLVNEIIKLIRIKRLKVNTDVEVEVNIGDKKQNYNGFIDSGNLLKEPISGKPVVIASSDIINELLSEEERKQRYTIIPFRSVGVSNGIMEGYRMDSITVMGKNIRSPVFAVSENGEKEKLILPGCLMERSIYAELGED